MDTKYLESSEFYNKRFNNFATLIIIPIAILIILIIIFSFFGHKQTIIKTSGELAPTHPLAVIQSTSSEKIISSQLTEGLKVHVGQKLVKFDTTKDMSQINLLKIEQNNAKNKISSINLLKQGIKENKNVFDNPDNFGMSDILSDYLNQLKVLQANNSLKKSASENTKNSYQKQNDTLKTIISQSQSKIADYQAVQNAVNQSTSVNTSNSQKSTYDQFEVQAKNLTGDDLQSLKSQTSNDLQNQIEQLTENLNNYVLQEQGLVNSDDSSILENEATGKESELQQNALVNADKEYASTSENLNQITAKLKMLHSDNKDNVITSPASGIIHQLIESNKENYYPKGSTIAEIYPELKTQNTLLVISYLPATKCVNLKIGQKANFKLTEKQPKTIVIKGTISKIDSVARQSSHGNYFKVSVKLPLSQEQKNYLRYGTNGQLTLITGEKTYFNYYKDLITK